jgi:hypothetical protein
MPILNFVFRSRRRRTTGDDNQILPESCSLHSSVAATRGRGKRYRTLPQGSREACFPLTTRSCGRSPERQQLRRPSLVHDNPASSL